MEVAKLLLLVTAAMCSITGGVVTQINTSEELWHHLCRSESYHQTKNVTLELTKSAYKLKNLTFCVIKNFLSFTLKAGPSAKSPVSIQCVSSQLQPSSSTLGFGFVNITELVIENLKFRSCGSVITSDAVVYFNDTHPFLGYKQKALLVFNHCYRVSIREVTVHQYYGYALMMLNPIGYSLIQNVGIYYGIGGSYCDKNSYNCAGSGIMYAFKDTYETNEYMPPVNVTITDSETRTNFNFIPNIPPLTLMGDKVCTLPLVGAASLTLHFNQSYVVHFAARNFKDGDVSGGSVAGSLLTLFYNGMRNTYASFVNTRFWSGFLLPTSKQVGGSGITVLSILCGPCPQDDIFDNGNKIPLNFNGISITGAGNGNQRIATKMKSLKYGGGMFFNLYQVCNVGGSSTILLKNVIFKLNYAYKSGSALYAYVSEEIKHSLNTQLSLVMEDTETLFCLQGDTSYAAYSTVPCITFTNWNNVTIKGGWFHDNHATTIASYNSELHLQGNILFEKNTALNGAAVYLQSSYLILHEPLHAKFRHNKALLYGGAIYATNTLISGHQKCAIQIDFKNRSFSKKIKLTFSQNMAELAGKSMYVSPLYNCSYNYLQNVMTYNSSKLFDWTSIIKLADKNTNNDSLKEISSSPVKICSCDEHPNSGVIINVHCADPNTIKHIISTYPGKPLSFSLCAVDDSGSIVYSAAVASIRNDIHDQEKITQESLYLKQGQTLVPLSGKASTLIHYNVYSKQNVETHAVLSIATPSNPPTWLGQLFVLPCPLGFILKNDECICNNFITQIAPLTKCNITTTTMSISSGQWIGITNFNKSLLSLSFQCPPGNCRTDTKYINVSDFTSYCEHSKTGVLCGQCSSNLSVVFGISECRNCSNYWLATLVMYMLSGLLLVIVMLFLPLTIADGPLAGIIMVMNLSTVCTIDSLQSKHWFVYTVRVFVSLMNLNLGFPLCFYNGMTPAVKTGLQFVYPLYLWLLVISFIFFSKHSIRISNRTTNNSVQVLASLIYLSFSKVLINCIDVFAYIHVYTADTKLTVWYGDGSILYLNSYEHMELFVAAVVSISGYIIPFILFGTFGRYCMRWNVINKYFLQLFEAFQGPYKPGKGYWFGVRMIVLTYICLTWSVIRDISVSIMLLMQLIPLGIMYTIQIYMKPFRSTSLNILDSFLLSLFLCQLFLRITFGGSNNAESPFLVFGTASLNFIVLIALVAVIGIRLMKRMTKSRVKCIEWMKENKQVTPIQDFEESDEMKRALFALADSD